MKKLLILLSTTLLVVVAVFSVACGGRQENSAAGIYKFTAINNWGEMYITGDSYYGDILKKDSAVIKLFENNTLEFVENIEGIYGNNKRGFWIQQDKYEARIYLEGDSAITAYINGNNLIIILPSSTYLILSK